eukprot:SM000075S21946  [mRNA]  locus=s75:201156:203212:+ [translate_table: standard]
MTSVPPCSAVAKRRVAAVTPGGPDGYPLPSLWQRKRLAPACCDDITAASALAEGCADSTDLAQGDGSGKTSAGSHSSALMCPLDAADATTRRAGPPPRRRQRHTAAEPFVLQDAYTKGNARWPPPVVSSPAPAPADSAGSDAEATDWIDDDDGTLSSEADIGDGSSRSASMASGQRPSCSDEESDAESPVSVGNLSKPLASAVQPPPLAADDCRAVLINWLTEAMLKLQVRVSELYLAVLLLDICREDARRQGRRRLDCVQLEVLGLTCLFLATNRSQTSPRTPDHFCEAVGLPEGAVKGCMILVQQAMVERVLGGAESLRDASARSLWGRLQPSLLCSEAEYMADFVLRVAKVRPARALLRRSAAAAALCLVGRSVPVGPGASADFPQILSDFLCPTERGSVATGSPPAVGGPDLRQKKVIVLLRRSSTQQHNSTGKEFVGEASSKRQLPVLLRKPVACQ